MKPNNAQMIDEVYTRIGSATHDGRLNFTPNQSANFSSQLIRCVRCAYPMPSMISDITAAATESPITWPNAAPRAAGAPSATTANTTAIASRLRADD
jgi:hypothetical protein